MKNNKLNIGLVAGLAAVVILILLLTMCTGPKEEASLALPTETAAETTAAPTEEPEATEETTAPTEETTEPTEETTEPTEETTEPTTSSGSDGSSTPGGSDGYDPGGDYDDGSGNTEETVEVPAAGTEKNPYVEVISQYPESVTSVNIPVTGGISYLITGSAGSVITIEDPDAVLTVNGTAYQADETGVVTLDMSAAAADAVIQLSNVGETEEPYVLNFNLPLGSEQNPVILTDIAQIDVNLKADNAEGCYYQWTATGTGTLTLTPAMDADDAEGGDAVDGNTEDTDTQISKIEIIVTVGEKIYKLSESEDGILTLDVSKLDVVQIQVVAIPDEAGKYPETTQTITGKFEIWPGTEENPYEYTLSTIPESFITVEIPADTHAYYHIYGAGGTVLMIEDMDAYIMYGNTTYNPVTAVELGAVEDGQPVILAVGNAGLESKTFTLNFAYKGTSLCPERLSSIESVDAALAEGDSDGYYYQWTAITDGTVTIRVESITPDTAACEVALSVSGSEGSSKLSESENDTVSADLEAGETLIIHVAVSADESGMYPAAQIRLSGSFAPAPGTEGNPIVIAELPSAITVSVGAEKTVYVTGSFYGQVLTIHNGAGAWVTYGEDTYSADEAGVITVPFPENTGEEAEAITISLTSSTAADYVLTFDYPEGSAKNPAALALGENRAVLEANASDGYIFSWTADCTGELTIAMDEEAHWQYAMRNVTAGVNGTVHTSGQETVISSETLLVSDGDVVQVIVNTYDPADTASTPDGTVTFTASFLDPLLGTSEKPIRLDPKETTEVTIPAGEYRYYTADAEEMILTVKGKYVIVSSGGDNYSLENGSVTLPYQSKFSLTNMALGDDQCSISFAYPVGHRRNPDKLVLGENTAILEAGNEKGYAFTWTAQVSGELTVTMQPDAHWQYTIGAESHNSVEDPLQASKTVTVTAGEEIRIVVNTFDPENPTAAPAGKVVFTAAFADPTLGTEANPITLGMSDSITLPAGKTVYYTAKADGMIMTLKGENITLTHNGTDYTPINGLLEITCTAASSKESPVFAITNHAETDAVCAVGFAYPLGHPENPVELKLGENKAVLEAGNREGWFYQWKATADGTLTITMHADASWLYRITNLTTAVSGELHTSADETVLLSETVKVSKGDLVQIMVNTYDPTTPLTSPGGELRFVASFAEQTLSEQTS